MLRALKASNYMTTSLVTVRSTTDIYRAIDLLLMYEISGLPVIDDKGNLIGMLSESDCLRSALSSGYYEDGPATVEAFMTTVVDTISPDEGLIKVTEIFIQKNRRRLPVVENGKLIGQISRRDVLKAIKEINQNIAEKETNSFVATARA